MTKRQDCDLDLGKTAVSRRTCVRGAVALVAGMPLVGAATLLSKPAAAETSQKISKKLASYQDEPKGKSSMCATCKYFIKPASCVIVEGTISPQGWCQRFDKRSDK